MEQLDNGYKVNVEVPRLGEQELYLVDAKELSDPGLSGGVLQNKVTELIEGSGDMRKKCVRSGDFILNGSDVDRLVKDVITRRDKATRGWRIVFKSPTGNFRVSTQIHAFGRCDFRSESLWRGFAL